MRNWQKKYMGFMMENHLYFAIYKVLSTFSTFSSILMQCKFHVNIWMCLLTRCNRRDQIFRSNKIVKYFFYVLIWIHVVWTWRYLYYWNTCSKQNNATRISGQIVQGNIFSDWMFISPYYIHVLRLLNYILQNRCINF